MRVTAQTKLETRRRILEAARRLFAQQGFESATTRDIAREAKVAAGTVFNYFPTKEAIAECLVSEAHARATEHFLNTASSHGTALTFEEELFAHIAAGFRQMKPYRKYLAAVLEGSLFRLGIQKTADDSAALQFAQLETVSHIAARHGHQEAFSLVASQLYWMLYVGVLAFWAADKSPSQEDTLALLDESIAMFVSWLTKADRGDPPPAVKG